MVAARLRHHAPPADAMLAFCTLERSVEKLIAWEAEFAPEEYGAQRT